MKTIAIVVALCAGVLLAGCSVVGKESVENAPYAIVKTAQDDAIEIRRYDKMILVSTPMDEDIDSGKNGAFRKLFGYISGDNVDQSKIAMTAPVFMDEAQDNGGTKIPMTAPVFMDGENSGGMMSFVMPDSFTMETTPVPTNPDVSVKEITDYTVATITFNGLLNQKNIDTQKDILVQWIEDNGYTQNGPYKAAGYNAPFTITALRRNEVLIPIKYNE